MHWGAKIQRSTICRTCLSSESGKQAYARLSVFAAIDMCVKLLCALDLCTLVCMRARMSRRLIYCGTLFATYKAVIFLRLCTCRLYESGAHTRSVCECVFACVRACT